MRQLSMALTLALVAAAACSKAPAAHTDDRGSMTPPGSGSGSASGSAGAAAPVDVPTATITLDGSSGPAVVKAEVVKSAGLVQKGLMYRKYMPDDHGMLFLMGEEDDHYFWMKNTFIPLDIMFIGKDMKVVGILYDMQPHDTNSKGVGADSLYVLEVNAGWAKAHGVSSGTLAHFDGVDAAAQ